MIIIDFDPTFKTYIYGLNTHNERLYYPNIRYNQENDVKIKRKRSSILKIEHLTIYWKAYNTFISQELYADS